MLRTRSVPVSSSRKARNVSVRREPKNRLKDRNVFAAVAHRHANGRILVVLNSRYEVLTAWSEKKQFAQLRCRVSEKNIRTILEEDLLPKILYVNDGTDLLPLSRSLPVIVYDGTLFEHLDRLRKEMHRKASAECVARANIPSFQSVRALDKNISYDDYRLIYGIK